MPQTKAQIELARKMELLAKFSNDAPSTEGMNFEGTQWRVPARYETDLDGAANDFVTMVRSYEENIIVQRTYNFRPYDGAHATYRMLVDFFGYAQGVRTNMKKPPEEISIPIGFIDGVLQHVTVPWGAMRLPLENATLRLDTTMEDGVIKFVLLIQGKKKYHRYFDGFLNAVETYLKANSIYAGKVMNGRFEFIDIERVDPSKFVYTEQTWAEAGAFIFSPLCDHDVIVNQARLSPRRAIILEGAYGGGKTGMLTAAAKSAWQHGWTSFLAEPGVDDPLETLRAAFQYADHGHRIFFACEDIDTFAKHKGDDYNTRLLDLYDSGLRKGYEIVMVATTNHVNEIQKGMMRSGRIDSVIEVGPMDRAGVERLCRIVVGDNLEDDIDYDAVYRATHGYMPAFVKEGIERSLRFVIAEQRKIGKVGTTALVRALESLRRQHELFEGAVDRHKDLPSLDQALRGAMAAEVAQVVESQPWVYFSEQAIANNDLPSAERIEAIVDNRIEERIDGAAVKRNDGTQTGSIQTNEA